MPRLAILLLLIVATGCPQREVEPPAPPSQPRVEKEPPPPPGPPAEKRLASNNSREWGAACDDLKKKGKEGVPPLLAAVQAGPLEKQFLATRALQEMPVPASAAPELLETLTGLVEKMRKEGRLAPRKESPGMMVWTTPADHDRYTCEALVRTLGNIGPAAANAIPLLESLVPEANGYLWRAIGQAGGKLGPKAAPMLVKMLPEQEEGTDAQQGLVRLGADAVPALIPALKDRSPVMRREALRTLYQIGPPAARPALPAIELLLNDHDLQVRNRAVRAYKAIRRN